MEKSSKHKVPMIIQEAQISLGLNEYFWNSSSHSFLKCGVVAKVNSSVVILCKDGVAGSCFFILFISVGTKQIKKLEINLLIYFLVFRDVMMTDSD